MYEVCGYIIILHNCLLAILKNQCALLAVNFAGNSPSVQIKYLLDTRI